MRSFIRSVSDELSGLGKSVAFGGRKVFCQELMIAIGMSVTAV